MGGNFFLIMQWNLAWNSSPSHFVQPVILPESVQLRWLMNIGLTKYTIFCIISYCMTWMAFYLSHNYNNNIAIMFVVIYVAQVLNVLGMISWNTLNSNTWLYSWARSAMEICWLKSPKDSAHLNFILAQLFILNYITGILILILTPELDFW